MTISEKLSNIAENEQNVYNAGKSCQHKEMWNIITKNGKRDRYDYCFFAEKWDSNNFFPIYDMVPSNASSMFRGIDPDSEELQIDMEELEQKQGIKFDFSKCTDFELAFAGGLFSSLNVIDMSSLTKTNYYVFTGQYAKKKLKKINRLIFSEKTKPNNSWFDFNEHMTHIGFDGVLAQNGLDIRAYKKLDRESIEKLINILSPETKGLTVTLSKIAVNNAFGIDINDETTYPEGSEYYVLRNTKSNWTFNYV